jgi:hypothetical protein
MRFGDGLASDSRERLIVTRGRKAERKERKRAEAELERRILCFRFALFVKFGNKIDGFFFLYIRRSTLEGQVLGNRSGHESDRYDGASQDYYLYQGRARQPDAVARLPRGAWWSRMVPK